MSTPLFVPAVQPIELFFFQRIFDTLLAKQPERRSGGVHGLGMEADDIIVAEAHKAAVANSCGELVDHDFDEIKSPEELEKREVPLIQFHRAMVRLFRCLRQPPPEVRFAKDDVNDGQREAHLQDHSEDSTAPFLGESPKSGSKVLPHNRCFVRGPNPGFIGWYEFCSFWKDHNITVRLSFCERVFLTLEDAERSIMGRIMSMIVFVAILVSTACFIISTVPDFQSKCALEADPDFIAGCTPQTKPLFKNVDLCCVMFFSLEYGCRLVLSGVMRMELVDKDRHQLLSWLVTDATVRHPSFLRRVCHWFFTPANLIDLAAIMPWYLSKAFENSGGSDSLLIRLIRLTRVVRAIRLGKKFEAVIIVARSVRRSMRALYVLVLNLILGVIIFGALMFFCEQGNWDKQKQAYVRPVGEEFNAATDEWQTVYSRSPFDSIPACFWWAIVTATTVGYGDMSPTTPAGKAVAGVTMAWSLCVLALPIGVIGNNFSQVWEEYDREVRVQAYNHQREQMMLNKSKAWGDPLHYSKRMILEVWHDPGLLGASKTDHDSYSSQETDETYVDQAEFMGEADFQLDLPTEEPIEKRKTVALRGNPEKARRRVRGFVSFEYKWTPGKSSDALIAGKLEVKIVSGHDLISIDWKGSCASDPYVKVIAHPQLLSDGHLVPVVRKSEAQWDTSDPKWDFPCEFDVNWSKVGTEKYMANDMRRAGDANDVKTKDPLKEKGIDPVEHERQMQLTHMVPRLQGELAELQHSVVPEIRQEMQDVKQDLLDIVAILRKRGGFGNGAISVPTEAPQQLMTIPSGPQCLSPVVNLAPPMVDDDSS